MTTENTPDPPPAAGPSTPNQPPSNTRVTVAGIGIGVLAAGWFLLSHFVMDTGVSDALGEAVGVALGLLVAISVIGAVLSARRRP